MARSVENPSKRFDSRLLEWDEGEAPAARLHVHEERCQSILSENDSPDLSFRYSVNPYRGCQHACAYCYARPSHQYWGFGAGTDFEREIVVKVNAPELLREAFGRPSWKGEPIAFSGNTDCYQPLEARYRLTRELLSICAEYKNPVAIITKSSLVTRDLDVLVTLSRLAHLVVFVSIPFADDANRAAIEAGAPPVHLRFRALSVLSEAGIETGVAVAPIIPGLNDQEIPAILSRAREAGARRAFCTLLRLPAEVKPVFLSRLREELPLRADKVEHAIKEMRGGKLYDARFGHRMHGDGPRWQAVQALFEMHRKRLGFVSAGDDRFEPLAEQSTFERPTRQLKLF